MNPASQLESFAKAILEHPPRWGVIGPGRHSKDPLTCLHELASHYTECIKGSCMAYQTAFLIAYFSQLTEEDLQELVSALRQIGLGDFLRRARVMIAREAKRGCKPEAIFIRKLKEPDLRVSQLSGNLQVISEEIKPGKVLATNTWGTRVRIGGFTLGGGQETIVPRISTKDEKEYLSLEKVVDHLAIKANSDMEATRFRDDP